jgi:hypothetical protein
MLEEVVSRWNRKRVWTAKARSDKPISPYDFRSLDMSNPEQSALEKRDAAALTIVGIVQFGTARRALWDVLLLNPDVSLNAAVRQQNGGKSFVDGLTWCRSF